MARIKIYDKTIQSWVYADESFSHIPVKGVDYYTEEEKNEFEDFIVDELAKRGQLKPEFANSIEECTDTTKLYVLPDGYIYAYMMSDGYTNLVPLATDINNSVYNGTGYQDGYCLMYSTGGAILTEQSGHTVTGFIPLTHTDIIRMSGVTWGKTNKNLIAFFDENKKPLGGYIGNEYCFKGSPEYTSDGRYAMVLKPKEDQKDLQAITIDNGVTTFKMIFLEKDRIINDGTHEYPGNSVKYVRISAEGNGKDMVVTLNEEIAGSAPAGYGWRNTGHAFVSTNYETRIAILEEKVEDIIAGGGGSSDDTGEKQTSGKIVTILPVPDTPIKIVSKITDFDTGFSAAKYLSLRHVRGKNLFDFCTKLGGAGATLTSSGLTGVVNANGTMTVTGTNAIEDNWAFKTQFLPDANGVGIFPAGTYTLSPHLAIEAKRPGTNWDGLGHGLTGTFTIDEPFWIRSIWIVYSGINTVVNETIPLYMAAGSAPLNTDFIYDGDFYMVTLTTAIANGEFNWETGELTDADGNVVEIKSSPVQNLTAHDGINTFISNTGDSIVTYTAKSSGGGGSTTDDVSIAFNPDAWGLPVLRLNGVRTGISKDNEVELSYIYGMKEGECTLKWQGSSSIKWPKKNYTIKFKDEGGIIIRDEWGAQKKYCLKANYIDFSHARNLVNAKLWGQVVKSRKNVDSRLKSLVNAGAVDGFPICLVINEEYQGIYTFNIPKDGWMFGMTGSAADEAIVCAGGADDSSAVLFRKANVVLDTDFDMEYAPDKNNTTWIKNSLDTLIDACINSDGTDLDTTIAKYLDWDSAIDFICFTTLINGFDCLSKNYILATFGGGKWFFSSYDMDSTYGLHWDGTSFFTVKGAYNNRASIGEFCRLHRAFELVKLYKKDALKARYAELRDGVLSEDNVATEFANFIGLIPKGVYDHECLVWNSIPNTSTNNLHQITDFYRRKCAVIDAEMNAL